jgi:hypothetical protein
MKKATLLMLLISFTMTLQAQTASEGKLLAAVEKLRLGMISGNRADLEQITSKDLSYGHSGGKIEDYTAFIETFASKKSDFVTAEFNKQTVKVSGKIGLVRHQLDAKTNDGGKPGEVHLGVLLVWKKEGGAWKLVGRQAFKLP